MTNINVINYVTFQKFFPYTPEEVTYVYDMIHVIYNLLGENPPPIVLRDAKDVKAMLKVIEDTLNDLGVDNS